MVEDEVPLTGGRVTAGVVRIGETVRRPLGARAPFVHELLAHLEARGVAFVPRFLGIDAEGREILSFLQGDVPTDLGYFSDVQLAAAARLLRSFHDATTDCKLRGNHEVVCHGDPGPCNSVFVHGLPVGLIDFDAAHAGSRRQDVGYAAWLWLSIGNEDLSPVPQGRRLRTFAGAYAAVELTDVVPAVLDVQAEFAERKDIPAPVSAWAARCRNWLEQHLGGVNGGLEEAAPRSRP
jgi:hypothetical protein